MTKRSIDLRDQAAHFSGLDEADLYAALLSEDEQVAFALGGRLARGKEIFHSLWREAGPSVCSYYHTNAKSFSNQIDGIALIAAPLLGSPTFRGVSVVAFTALAFKIGFEKLCRDAVRS